MMRREFLVGIAATSATTASLARTADSREAEKTCFVTARDGTKLFVREAGQGRPVLFLHSWALSSEMWRHQFADLAPDGFRAMAYDRRGHGASDVPASGYDMDRLADDLADIIEALDLRDLVLVGHSMGGAEIIRYVGRHGTARIAKIVLLAPTTPYLLRTADNPYGAPAAYFEAVRAAWTADFPGWIEQNKRPFFTPDTPPDQVEWLAGLMARTPVPVLVACNRAVVETDLRPDLARVDRPTLVIQGDKDASAPLEMTGRRTASGIVGAKLDVYPGAPHGLFLTHRARVNRDVLAFMDA